MRRFSLLWLPALILVTNTAYAGLFTYQGLVGASHHATAVTGLYGSILLVLALVPANLLRIRQLGGVRALWVPIRFLAGLRKPLGISAGVWFAAHTIVGLKEYFDLSSGVLRQFLIGDMLVGVVAMVVFAALLLTSNDASQRLLGKKAWTHAGLVVAGTAAAVVIYAASWAAVGPWEFERDRPAGPPPDAMEKGSSPKGG